MDTAAAPLAPDTAIDTLAPTLARLRAAQSAHVRSYAQRMDDLERLRAALKARLDAMHAAISADFGSRSRHETMVSDGMTVLTEVDHLRRHLKRWMKPQRRHVAALFLPARAELRFQPLGVVGIIAPWNYPVNLALVPLATAIAAGNHVYLKPSEHTPRTSEFLRRLLADVFPPERVAVAIGDGSVAGAFAGLPFDHLLFTGSTAVGRKVLAAAAPNLTPVTLELGGKSPAIIADGYPLDRAAARIASGKWLNAGQTCIAPDYVFVPRAQRDAFVAALTKEVGARYPSFDNNADFTHIVNDAQYLRLRGYLDDARQRGLQVLELGTSSPSTRLLPPTLVLEPGDDARVMQDEIFGPILPILSYDDLDTVIADINRRDRPLALYHFDHDRDRTQRVLDRTIAGGVSINDTVMHFAQADLPFGGVGPSGMGHYHGREGFLTFSKQKPVFYQSRLTGMALFKPPYRGLADRLVKFLTR